MVLGKPEQCGWTPVLPTKPAYSFGHKHPFHGAAPLNAGDECRCIYAGHKVLQPRPP